MPPIIASRDDWHFGEFIRADRKRVLPITVKPGDGLTAITPAAASAAPAKSAHPAVFLTVVAIVRRPLLRGDRGERSARRNRVRGPRLLSRKPPRRPPVGTGFQLKSHRPTVRSAWPA
jgi:hypothetical protein